jgi:hypothetical protein
MTIPQIGSLASPSWLTVAGDAVDAIVMVLVPSPI